MNKNILSRDFSRDRVESSFSSIAWFYNLWSHLTESKAEKQVFEFADIGNGKMILEVAVGTGILFSRIAERNASGSNIGIDISTGMLSKAKKLLGRKSLANYSLLTGNAYELPFVDETFDTLVNMFMIDLLPEGDFEQILGEFKRVLKPAGRLVVATMSFGESWYNRFWYILAKKFPSLLTNCRPISLKGYLAQVGFTNMQSVKISQNTFPSEVILADKL